MIKKVMLGIAVVAMAIAIGEKAVPVKGTDNELLLQNVEALATSEQGHASCAGIGCVSCPITHIKVKYVYELANIDYDK